MVYSWQKKVIETKLASSKKTPEVKTTDYALVVSNSGEVVVPKRFSTSFGTNTQVTTAEYTLNGEEITNCKITWDRENQLPLTSLMEIGNAGLGNQAIGRFFEQTFPSIAGDSSQGEIAFFLGQPKKISGRVAMRSKLGFDRGWGDGPSTFPQKRSSGFEFRYDEDSGMVRTKKKGVNMDVLDDVLPPDQVKDGLEGVLKLSQPAEALVAYDSGVLRVVRSDPKDYFNQT